MSEGSIAEGAGTGYKMCLDRTWAAHHEDKHPQGTATCGYFDMHHPPKGARPMAVDGATRDEQQIHRQIVILLFVAVIPHRPQAKNSITSARPVNYLLQHAQQSQSSCCFYFLMASSFSALATPLRNHTRTQTITYPSPQQWEVLHFSVRAVPTPRSCLVLDCMYRL